MGVLHRSAARRSFRPIMAGPILVVFAAVSSPCHAQDSIAVVDRGMPPPRFWAVVEAPFKVLEVPFRLAGAGVGWVAERAEAGRWVPSLRRFHGSLETHWVQPLVTGLGPNSGAGPALRLGPKSRPESAVWGLVRGTVTLRDYWQLEALLGVGFAVAQQPVSAEAFVRHDDRPKEAFFGIGNDAAEGEWSDYALRRTAWGGRLALLAPAHLAVRLGFDWTRVETARGREEGLPNIDSTFSPAERPGFGQTHRSFSLAGAAEWSAGARHAIERRGSWVAVGYRWRESRTAGVPDVRVVSTSGGVELPFDHHRRSVALAVYLESLRPESPGEVPFYLLPTLGGTRSLPAFRSDRFRNRDVLVGKLEYRYRIWSDPPGAVWADAVLFTYGGMVAGRLGHELASARVHGNPGFALALIARHATLARVGISHSADGIGITVALGPTF